MQLWLILRFHVNFIQNRFQIKSSIYDWKSNQKIQWWRFSFKDFFFFRNMFQKRKKVKKGKENKKEKRKKKTKTTKEKKRNKKKANNGCYEKYNWNKILEENAEIDQTHFTKKWTIFFNWGGVGWYIDIWVSKERKIGTDVGPLCIKNKFGGGAVPIVSEKVSVQNLTPLFNMGEGVRLPCPMAANNTSKQNANQRRTDQYGSHTKQVWGLLD